MKKYTKEELEKWWIYRCEECGAVGLSRDLIKTDSFDVCCFCCPKCFANEYHIKDYEKKESFKNKVKCFFRFVTFYRFRLRINGGE